MKLSKIKGESFVISCATHEWEDSFQASAYEKQGRATIARLVSKFRGYSRVKNRTPPTK